jgi:plasmid stabilization system protein ParE
VAEPTIDFDPRATKDLKAAIEWYDRFAPELGDRFVACLDELLERVARHPSMYRCVEAEARRALLRQFPYAVYYRLDDAVIRIIAILHTSRRPDYWRERGE